MFTCVRIHERSHVRLHTHTTYIHMYTRKLYIYTYTCKYIYLHIVEQSCFLRPFHLHGFIFFVLSLSLSLSLTRSLSFSLSLSPPLAILSRNTYLYIYNIYMSFFPCIGHTFVNFGLQSISFSHTFTRFFLPLLIRAVFRILSLLVTLVHRLSLSLPLSLSLSLSLFRYSLRSSYKCTLVTIMYWTMFNNVMNAHAGHSVCSPYLRECISYFRVRCTYVYACTSIMRVSKCIRHAFLVHDLLQFYDTTMTTILLFARCLSRSCFLSPHSGSRGFVRSPSRLRDPTLSTRVQMFTFQREIVR